MPTPSRNDAYRQLRIMVDPAPASGTLVVTVVARTSRRGEHRDRLLLRVVVSGDLAGGSAAEALKDAAKVIYASAEALPPLPD